MASQPASGDPQHLLAATRDLTRRVRREQRGAWFPLLVFALVTFAAIPFDRYGHRHPAHCATLRNGQYICTAYSPLVLWYWPVALVLGYLAISWFYVRLGRRRGVGTQVQPYLIVGVLLAALSTVWAVWSSSHPAFLAETLHPGSGQPTDVLHRLAGPAGAIGLALLLLAWIERSWALSVITVGYLIVIVAMVDLGRITHPSVWAFLPHLLVDGGVLLLGGTLLALTQRPQGRPSA